MRQLCESLHRTRRSIGATVLGIAVTLSTAAPAQQPAGATPEAKPADPAGSPSTGEATNDREKRLAEYLNGCKFVGRFTVDGREDAIPKTEEYTISRCEKLPAENMYRLTARIRYGEVDSEVPLEVPILWSGNTPVITLDAFWIPGMGTFSSRVLIQDGRYAGTWQHDAVGGHMFGKIVQLQDESP